MSTIQKTKKLWALVMQPEALQALQEANRITIAQITPDKESRETISQISDTFFEAFLGPFSVETFSPLLNELHINKEQLTLLAAEMNQWMFTRLDSLCAEKFTPEQFDTLLAFLESPLSRKMNEPDFMKKVEAESPKWHKERLIPLLTAYLESIEAGAQPPTWEKIETTDPLLDRLFIAQQYDPHMPVWTELQLQGLAANEATAPLRDNGLWEPFKAQLSRDGFWRRFIIQSRRALFTEEEILALIAFYESPVGVGWRTLFPALSTALDQATKDGSFQKAFEERLHKLLAD